MIDCEFKELYRSTWSERFNFICFGMTKNKNYGEYSTFKESKNTYMECIPETELPK